VPLGTGAVNSKDRIVWIVSGRNGVTTPGAAEGPPQLREERGKFERVRIPPDEPRPMRAPPIQPVSQQRRPNIRRTTSQGASETNGAKMKSFQRIQMLEKILPITERPHMMTQHGQERLPRHCPPVRSQQH